MRCPFAEWVPWRPRSDSGQATFYAGANRPAAVVLHIMQGYQRTARQWALEGHFGASWHYSVGRDGAVMQHLEHHDGGYHAGIAAAKAAAHPPTWRLWRGPAVNVNHYTIGVEHEGFAGIPFTPAQAEASRRLCRWLATVLDIPLDSDHFVAHADIDPRDRPNDFDTPPLRDAHYAFLFVEDPMDDRIQQLEERLARLERIAGGHGADTNDQRLTGPAALEWLDRQGISLALTASRLNAALRSHLDQHNA